MTKLSKKKEKMLADIGHVLHIPAQGETGHVGTWLLSSVLGKPLPGSRAYMDPDVCKGMVKRGELVKLKDDQQTGGIIYRVVATPNNIEGVNTPVDGVEGLERDPGEPDDETDEL
jgi:hypothetical protein